jgi:hypothetical protein
MSQTGTARLSPEEEDRRLWRGFGNFIDRVTPSLFELGAWLFGSLIAFNLLVLASLFTIGPLDSSIKIATVAFAWALPLNLIGLFLLRMVQQPKGVELEDELVRAFQEQGFVSDQIPSAPDLAAALASMRRRRTVLVLRFSSGILVLSVLLTLSGLTATLWYMSWWIAVSFLAMVLLCIVIAVAILAASQASESSKED